MLRFICITALAVGCAMAETSIPKDAVEVESGVYKYTDSTGKTYTYKKSPFGVVKSLDKPAAQTAESTPATPATPSKAAAPTATPFGDVQAPATPQAVKVSDRGDVLEFERPSPFGSYKWKRKKTELTASEREEWERSQKHSDGVSGTKE